jgi:hypothetical protein
MLLRINIREILKNLNGMKPGLIVVMEINCYVAENLNNNCKAHKPQ